MWWMAIPTVAGAVMGAQHAQRQAEQQKNYNLGQAEVTRYSPWTHQSGQLDHSYTPSGLEGAIGGAASGFGMAQGIGNAFKGSGSPDVSAPPVAPQGPSYFGGQGFAQQLGNQGAMFQNSMGSNPNLFAGR